MSAQLGLFAGPRPMVHSTRRKQIDVQFRDYHASNPEVWALFCRFTQEVMEARHHHYSADAIVHRIRWETSVITSCESGFKINNNFVACYARAFHATYPEHIGFFRTRARVSEHKPPTQYRHLAAKLGAT